MTSVPTIRYGTGLEEGQFRKAAQLYDEAFGQKFSVAIKSRADRIALFKSAFVAEFAVTANDGNELVGLAGFQTSEGSLTGGIDAGQLFARLGVLRGLRAIAIFSLYERTPKPGELVMDGIAVHQDYRRQGIGGKLLECVVNHAKENGFTSVRLDVIDTNPRAKRLYERSGFVPIRTQKFFYLRWLLGFGGATTMEFRIASVT